MQQQQQQQRGSDNGSAVAAGTLGAIAGVSLLAGAGASFIDGGESFAPMLQGLGQASARAGLAVSQGNRGTSTSQVKTAIQGTKAAESIFRGLSGFF